MLLRKFVFVFILIIFVCPVFALNENDVKIDEEDLKKLGLEILKDRYSVSIQAFTLYTQFEQKMLEKIVPIPQKQYFISTGVNKSKSTIYYYEFNSYKDAEGALNFIRPFIWGSDKPSAMHPERIIHIDNYVIIISSPKENHFDYLLLKKIVYMPVPDELFLKLYNRMKCKTKNFDSPCGVLNTFIDKKNLAIKEAGPCFGEAWEVDKDGNVKKQFFEVIEIRKDNGSLKGYWTPIKPDNDTEKAQLLEILNNKKNGNTVKISNDLLSFLDSVYKKNSSEVILKDTNLSFMAQKGNVALIRKVDEGMILIVTSEHWVGKPVSFIVAYFWNK